jgi:hypothetical protein
MKRKARKKEVLKNPDLLEPLDLTIFGGINDPCFGKHYDPKAPECKVCGDCEICAIVLANNLKKQRLQIEKEKSFKDLEDAEIQLKHKRAKRYAKKKAEEGWSNAKIIRRAAKRYELTEDKIKEICKL